MHVVVIGDPSSLRSQNILNLSSLGYDLEYMQPFYPADNEPGLATDYKFQLALIGRRLTKGEVGCWMAHHLARLSIAHRECHEFHLVLEDDADCDGLPRAEVLSDLVTRKMGTSRPGLLNLYSKGRFSDSGKLDIHREVAPNSGTVGYLLNLRACGLDLTIQNVRTTADWPSQFYSCRFFRASNFGVREAAGQSIVGNRITGQSSIFFYLTAGRRMILSLLLGIDIREALWATLLAPLARDLKNRLTSKS